MKNPESYDAIVIGAGQGGGPLSTALANAGMRTALIERLHVGGTCINEGCTPTKTMIASGRVAYLARRAADYGVQTGPISIDMQKIRQRKRDIVTKFRSGSETKIKKSTNVDLIFGEASFSDPKSVSVSLQDGGERRLTAERIFINAGTRTSRPKIDGLDTVAFLDNISIMELGDVPDHLLILGGGYIGLEFGQLFRRLGSRITIVEPGKQLLEREDSDVAEEIRKILEQDGVSVLLNTKVDRISAEKAQVQLTLNQGGNQTKSNGSHLLVATGRTPNSDSLNLPAAGIKADSHGFIEVNEHLETSVEGIYALGDIKGGPAFTHISYDDYRILRTNLLEKGQRTTKDRIVPYTVFIDPQLGRVGMSEAEAREKNMEIRIAKLPMSSVARAIEVDETRGFMKAVVDARSEQILGAAVLGIEGGEVMAVLETAMMGRLPYTALRDATYAHPTLAESLNNLFMAIDKG